jgi:hypothetical protein
VVEEMKMDDEFEGMWDQALREQAENIMVLDSRGHEWLRKVLESDRAERKERKTEWNVNITS